MYIKSIVLHVTGTKGKGSTCAFIESILGLGKQKRVGVFSSPHLVRVTERFRVAGSSCTDQAFIDAFWEVYDALHRGYEADLKDNTESEKSVLPPVPGYFRLLTLVCLWLFAKESIEVAVIEVGCGGRYDATNIMGSSYDDWCLGVVRGCGITTLDLDHTETLGDTLEAIAFEKGGIFKPGALAVTVKQPNRVLGVLKSCLSEGSKLKCARELTPSVSLGLCGDFQRVNAALAVALVLSLETEPEEMAVSGSSSSLDMLNIEAALSVDIVSGLMNARWPGRCHTLPPTAHIPPPSRHKSQPCPRVRVRYHLDCAHTPKSVGAACDWFCSVTSPSSSAATSYRILIFNCSHEKDPVTLLRTLAKDNTFDCAVFCPPSTGRFSRFELPSLTELLSESSVDSAAALQPKPVFDIPDEWIEPAGESAGTLQWQRTLAHIWCHVSIGRPSSLPSAGVARNIRSALYWASTAPAATAVGNEVEVSVLVIGSVYLVGGALELLGYGGTDGVGPGT